MDNIVENNKLIAEFMGWKENKDMEVKLTSGGITYYFQKNDEACIPETMCYHSDWNWLMKVVEKCLVGEAEYNEDEAKKAIREIYESLCNINISSVYNACVEFIKWYNEQNKNNEKHTCIIDK